MGTIWRLRGVRERKGRHRTHPRLYDKSCQGKEGHSNSQGTNKNRR